MIDEFDALSVELRVHEAAIRVMNATPDATEPHDVERLRGVPFIELLAEESGFSEVEVWNIVTQPGYAIRTMRGGSKATLHPGDRVLYGDDDDEPWIAHVVEVLDEHRLRLSVDGSVEVTFWEPVFWTVPRHQVSSARDMPEQYLLDRLDRLDGDDDEDEEDDDDG